MSKLRGLAALHVATRQRELVEEPHGDVYLSEEEGFGPSASSAAVAEPSSIIKAPPLPDIQEIPPTAPAAPPPPLERPQNHGRVEAQDRAPEKKVSAPVPPERGGVAPRIVRRAAPPRRAKATAQPEPKPTGGDRVHTSIYLPRDLRRSLRQIAAVEECKVHDLLIEAIIDLVAKRAIART